MKEKIKKLRDSGLTYKEIEKLTGLNKGTISYHCNDNVKKKALKRQKERRNLVKLKLIEYKGGKCFICGYNKCNAALEFHHLDFTKKEFSVANQRTRSFENLKIEVDKCILVCSNCHKEIHYN